MLICLIGCVPRSEKEVVVYSSADREFATPILAAFERRHPDAQVATQFDLEASKTVGLVTRIENEKAQPRCDLFWNNEIMHTLRLEKAGLLASRSWNIPGDWPKNMRSPQGTWVAFAARARILIVNRKEFASREEYPTSVLQLADPKWKGKCAVALPLFGTTATHFAVLRQRMGAEAADEWFKKVRDNAVVVSGNKQVAQAVSSGQCAFGLTDTDDWLVEKDNGLPVDVVYPDQDFQVLGQFGTLMIPNTLCVMKNAPHPVNAGLLADYLLSQDIEGRLAMGPSGQFPMRPNHPQKSRAAPAEPIRTMDVDFYAVAEQWDTAAEHLRAIFHAPQ
ncbi:MAG: extracellular solute-binding protein [Pirellulales bacterium]